MQSRILDTMATFGAVLSGLKTVRDASRPYARFAAALIAGIVITFTTEITTFTALTWLSVIVAVSLAMADGPENALNKFAWWSTLVVAAMTVLGLIVGKMSTATALSLAIALVAFETSRAFTRSDRIWLWSTGVLAVALTILYFGSDPNDRTAAGLTGGWAIIAGIFGLISAVDALLKSRRTTTPTTKPSAPKVASKATTSASAPKTPARKSPSTTKAEPRGTKR